MMPPVTRPPSPAMARVVAMVAACACVTSLEIRRSGLAQHKHGAEKIIKQRNNKNALLYSILPLHYDNGY